MPLLKKIYLLLLFSVTVPLFASAGIERITEKFTATNTLTKKPDEIFFVAEKVTTDRLGFWKNFVEKEAIRLGAYASGSNDGIDGLRETLNNVAPRISTADFYVVYVSSKEHLEEGNIDEYLGNVEICFSVFSSQTSPFSTHMGIFRTKVAHHDRLSMPLHAFAARMVRSRYPHTKYMITNPVSVMSEIFKKSLPGQVYVGSSHNLDRVNELIAGVHKNIQDDKEEMANDLKSAASEEEKKEIHKKFENRFTRSNIELKDLEDNKRLILAALNPTLHPGGRYDESIIIGKPVQDPALTVTKEQAPWYFIHKHLGLRNINAPALVSLDALGSRG